MYRYHTNYGGNKNRFRHNFLVISFININLFCEIICLFSELVFYCLKRFAVGCVTIV